MDADSILELAQADQLQALWRERTRLQAKLRKILDLCSIPGGPGPVQVRDIRILAEQEFEPVSNEVNLA